MAARKKPSIRNAKPTRQPEPVETETEMTLFEEKMLSYSHAVHVAMNAVAEQLKVLADAAIARNDLIEQDVEARVEANKSVAKTHAVAAEVMAEAKPAEVAAAVAAPEPKKRGRKPAAPEPEKQPEPEKKEPVVVEEFTPAQLRARGDCKHMEVEKLQRPGLARCLACNAIIDIPVEPVAVPEKKAEPPPAPKVEEKKPEAPPPAPKINPAAPVTSDDLRAVAIVFAGKHGKPKLAEVLKKYGATNISGVPEEQRAALMLELSAA